MDQVEFYKKQISLTEWLDGMGHKNAAAIRQEDIEKYDRLDVLREVMGLPYGQPQRFPASAVASHDPKFEDYVREHSAELCMIRLAPKEPGQPKLRMRGKSVAEAVEWFKQQKVDPAKYDIYLVPHAEDHSWSTIFVVNEHGVFGEAIIGAHNKLTQGLYEANEKPITFSFDFADWQLNPANDAAGQYLRELVGRIKVEDPSVQKVMQDKLGAKFSHDYLCGYFETTSSLSLGTWFLDYSRTLGEMYQGYSSGDSSTASSLVSGQVGNPGRAVGKVHIVQPEDVESTKLTSNEILVCRMTTPDYLPLMQQAGAIVTDLGGILSHAAIVARELGKPCITATTNATKVLGEGQLVEVDADAGVVRSADARSKSTTAPTLE